MERVDDLSQFGPGPGQRHGDCPGPIELIVYVSEPAGSAAAIADVKHMLSPHLSNSVTLTIRDVAETPSVVVAGVADTPPLAGRSPRPRTLILGHLTNPKLVRDLLEDCEPAER